ncbi:hypothetical protein [Microbulbifer spongiae]|uniref:NodB homology domain-containing protein n=1 Tax=Microbulbifer spongiae TaxID=2944933 RepID=A0ABY9E8A6_9GAMM|nr:hypothetical protein [Microbulbifer sp. MI-G]WKD48382.1 hypothetical protein M8T91_10590 [Microbulbifer sp. MI-G]
MIAAGHQLGNHDYSHVNLSNLPLSSAKEEIKKPVPYSSTTATKSDL